MTLGAWVAAGQYWSASHAWSLFVDGSFLGPLLTGSLLQVGCVYALEAAGLERGAAFDSESVAALEEGMTEADVLRLLGEPNDQSKADRDVAYH